MQMVRSRTWNRKEGAKIQQRWGVAAVWIFVLFEGMPARCSEPAEPKPFLVSRSVPYRLPPQIESAAASLSAKQVGQLASDRCGAANRISSDSQSRVSSAPKHGREDDCEQQILRAFQGAIATRLRQTAAANAMKLHFGIAACLKVEKIFDSTAALLERQEKSQSELVEKGIPIPDPTLVGRLKINLEDKRLENHSKIAVLRSQLAALIGTEYACGHAPDEADEIVPSDCNVCDHIAQASHCRCDLVSMRRLRSTVQSETLDAWDSIASTLSGIPSLMKPKPFLSKVLSPVRSRAGTDNAIAARRRWLDEMIADREKQIAMEVDVAFEKKRSAALRWVNAAEQIANWDYRIAQLESLSEVQGNLASQFEAKLNRGQIEGQKIERWSEWHLANIDLMLAIGCDL